MKNFIIHIFHIITFFFTILSFSLILYFFPNGNIWTVMKNIDYINTEQYRNRINENIQNIFLLSKYQNVFENNNSLNLNKIIISCYNNDEKQDYSLNDLLKYSRNMGLYIDENNEIKSDKTYRESNPDFLQNKLVTYKAYNSGFIPSPNISMNLEEICKEFFIFYNDYNKYKKYYYESPNNIEYVVHYENSFSLKEYTNNLDITLEEIFNSSQYIYASDTENIIKTNIKDIDTDLFTLLLQYNPYSSGDINSKYYFAMKINDSFSMDDSFQEEYLSNVINKRNAIILYILFMLSIILYLSSIVLLYYFYK
ncbi:MAG: hypothetical protein Q4F88_06945, partial [Eubacteriales bacterium]|nr:hypothetical protein [Eubacteriales bacterium]